MPSQPLRTGKLTETWLALGGRRKRTVGQINVSVWQEKDTNLSRLCQLLLIRCVSCVLPLSDGYHPGFCALLLQLIKPFSKMQMTSLLCPSTSDVTLFFVPFSFALIFISLKNDLISRNTHLLDHFYHKHSRMCINIETCLFQDIFCTLHPVNGLD